MRQVIKVMKPLVHWQVDLAILLYIHINICDSLNDMMTLPPDEDDEADNAEEDS